MIAHSGEFSTSKKAASVNKPIFDTLAPYMRLPGKYLFSLPLVFNKSKYNFPILGQEVSKFSGIHRRVVK